MPPISLMDGRPDTFWRKAQAHCFVATYSRNRGKESHQLPKLTYLSQAKPSGERWDYFFPFDECSHLARASGQNRAEDISVHARQRMDGGRCDADPSAFGQFIGRMTGGGKDRTAW